MTDLAKQVFEQATMLQKRYVDGFKAGRASVKFEVDVKKISTILKRYQKCNCDCEVVNCFIHSDPQALIDLVQAIKELLNAKSKS